MELKFLMKSSSAQLVELPATNSIPLTAVVFRSDLYPRIETSATTVQKYAEDLTVLPPIEVNQHNELIDGWHRWIAHKKVGAENIPVTITKTESDADLLELAIERNAKHGLQLSQEDKRDMARKIYHITPERERDAKKRHLAKILSVSERTIRDWLSRIDKDAKDARDKRIFDLWLACYTDSDIAAEVNISREAVNDITGSFGKLAENTKPAASHLTDFDPPIYNIWKQQEKSSGAEHFGNSEPRWVDNLLYLYTEPFDIVVDPFAGGGSTIDICKKRFRRYWVSDRKRPVEREHQIREYDLTAGLPKIPRWQDVQLVYLDPPYWKQAEGRYSNDPTDLANMALEQFTESLAGIINGFAKKLKPGAVIALLLQPTQWKAENHEYTDHVADMMRSVKLPIDLRVQCPYESQQCTAQMVEWAKQNRKVLVLSRELVIWRIPDAR
jgi:ParB-like chromosome segregation protein Spo0J